jgi:hypothetical protein
VAFRRCSAGFWFPSCRLADIPSVWRRETGIVPIWLVMMPSPFSSAYCRCDYAVLGLSAPCAMQGTGNSPPGRSRKEQPSCALCTVGHQDSNWPLSLDANSVRGRAGIFSPVVVRRVCEVGGILPHCLHWMVMDHLVIVQSPGDPLPAAVPNLERLLAAARQPSVLLRCREKSDITTKL